MESVAPVQEHGAVTLKLSDFRFDLPPELIAQTPVDARDHARLLVLDRAHGGLTHTQVHALPDFLRAGDLLVINDTRVVPARLFARVESGGAVELLVVRRIDGDAWLCLGRPARRLRSGVALRLPDATQATVMAARGDGRYAIAFEAGCDVPTLLERHGEVPLPPYIRRPDGPLPLDRVRYQTVFASVPGAIAAPTAGLHFTDDLLSRLRQSGVEVARLTLHVGPGTFLPVRSEDVLEHTMEAEWCEIPAATAENIGRVKAGGGRIVAVGTTTTRALESAAADAGGVHAGTRWADRFIVPGQRFRVVDALFTNFHLPGSTLVLLVGAFAGQSRILAAYAEAVRRRYRFYSYGDAMLIQ